MNASPSDLRARVNDPTVKHRGLSAKPETARIIGLPILLEDRANSAVDMTDRLLTPEGRRVGAYRLRPIQSAALSEMVRHKGLVGSIGVGHGKFLISALAGHVLKAKRPLIIVPAPLVAQTRRELKKWRAWFRIPDNVQVVSYHTLSMPASAELLDELNPDALICDEAHMLRLKESTRTKRVIRYVVGKEKTAPVKCVFLSGTITSRSLMDYVHLVEMALRGASPVPLEYRELKAWSRAIDVGGSPDKYDRATVAPLVQWAGEGSTPRDAFLKRWRSAPGVVTTDSTSLGVSIYMQRKKLKQPPPVAEALSRLTSMWELPDGTKLENTFEVARHRAHMACGFWYRWAWPDDKPDLVWLKARRNWFREVRRVLKKNMPRRDSPYLLQTWAASDTCNDLGLLDAWERWSKVRHVRAPPVETMWLSRYVVTAALRLAASTTTPLIIWTEHRAMLEALEEAGMTTYGPGTDPPEEAHTCAMSRRAHGTGKNLQAWADNVILHFPPNGTVMEQLIGRTHRPGQLADAVNFVYLEPSSYTKSAIEKALDDAIYIERTQGTPQKLLACDWLD